MVNNINITFITLKTKFCRVATTNFNAIYQDAVEKQKGVNIYEVDGTFCAILLFSYENEPCSAFNFILMLFPWCDLFGGGSGPSHEF